MASACDVKRVVICGAAGRDFHNFNAVYRDDATVQVVAFTATQIPGIDDRRYPAELAGQRYPEGIPIVPDEQLETLCLTHDVDQVAFSYSDVDYRQVMQHATRTLACGADFILLGPDRTMLPARVPVIAVCAVRTGCGKSQIARYLVNALSRAGHRTVAMRHPMPYGDLTRQIVQRFASMADLDAAACTLEEREEYEPHINNGGIVYAGVDYQRIMEQAQTEADIIIWDGGNNDFSFLRPDVQIVVVDALRPDHLDTHYPGAAVLRHADLVVISKADAASPEQLDTVRRELHRTVPNVPHLLGASPVTLAEPDAIKNKRVLIVEDGPTITHGGMPHGAGYQAVSNRSSAIIVDPRASATPAIAELYETYRHIGPVLPAMGYNPAQLEQLKTTINAADIDAVVAGTPIDLARALDVRVPVVRAHYQFRDMEEPGLMHYVNGFLQAAVQSTN